jgi:bifunctional DNA-binding transcriptional regulator/antitoxin component of YhaV-PrlF toxin-antitoxin module
MVQHGKITTIDEEPQNSWTAKRAMEKSRKYLGLEMTVSRQGQITIPSLLMRKFNVMPGDKVRFTWLSVANNKSRLLIEMSRGGKRMLTLRVLIRTMPRRLNLESTQVAAVVKIGD